MKLNFKTFLSISICLVTLLYGCNIPFTNDDEESVENEEIEEELDENEEFEENIENKEKVSREVMQDVEIFEVGDKKGTLVFTKTGTLKPFKTIDIIPEINGKIIDLKIKEGDKVKKGELIAELGDSLNTDNIQLQYQNALDSLALSQNSKKIIRKLADQNIASADVNIQMSNDSYNNSIRTKTENIEMLWHQRDSLQLTLDNAEKGKTDAYNNYTKAKKALKDAEEAYYEYTYSIPIDMQDPNIAQELKLLITSSEAAVEGAIIALEQAEYGKDQAKLAYFQFEETYDVQTQGLSFSVESTESQKELAKIQRETADITKDQQLLSADSQLLQAQASLKTAELSLARTKILAPIDGVISDLLVEESEFANPGQPIAVVETDNKMIAKTSVNEKERNLLEVGDEVIVSDNEFAYEGRITEISPSLNEISRKIDVEIEIRAKNLTSGALVDIEFQPKSKKTVFIPLNSVFILDGEKFVKVVSNDNRIQYLQVEPGLIIGNFVEIKEGLSKHDLVVTNQTQFLDQGDKINPIEYEG
ncbi:efflux RND transporter periplasmic adaptor subunit [Patescibacteria group bacterium]